MLRKLGLLCMLLALQLTATGQVPAEVQLAVSNLERGLRERDTSFFMSSLDGNFSVSTATLPSAKWYLEQVLNRPATLKSIRILSNQPEVLASGLSRIEVEVVEEGNPAYTSGIVVNKDSKIVYVDFFDELWGSYRYKPAVLKAVVPFELCERGIILTLRLNDSKQPLRFLFDSGADGLAIRASLADSLGLPITRTQSASVVGGTIQISISSGNVVHLDTLSIGNQSIALFEDMHHDIDGIIGLTLARQLILSFNIDQRELAMYSMGRYTYPKGGVCIPITVPSGVAHIEASINLTGKGYTKGCFVLDTGAAYYLIGFSPWVRKHRLLLSGFKPEEQGSTVSLGKVTPVYKGRMHSLCIGDTVQLDNVPITLQASSGDGGVWNPGVDGSIGINLLARYNFTINLLEKELYLVPNKLGLEYF